MNSSEEVCELEDVIDRDRSVVYRHLKKLESVGLISTKRAGKRVECEVRDKERVNGLLEVAGGLAQKERVQTKPEKVMIWRVS